MHTEDDFEFQETIAEDGVEQTFYGNVYHASEELYTVRIKRTLKEGVEFDERIRKDQFQTKREAFEALLADILARERGNIPENVMNPKVRQAREDNNDDR